MKTQTSVKTGFTLVEIMIVVAIIGLLAAIALPNFIRARQSSQTNACINNLRQIDGAEQQWALEQGKTSGAVCVAGDLIIYLPRGAAGVHCPLVPVGAPFAGYTIQPVGQAPLCDQQDLALHNAVMQ